MTSSAILFDGTTDFMTRGAALDGVVDSKTGIFSCWIRIDGGDATNRNFFVTAVEKVRLRFLSTNELQLRFKNGNPAAVFRTTITLTTSASYFHALGSWDVENDIVQLYIDDVDRTDQELPDPTIDSNLDYTINNWAIGADISGNFKFQGATFDFYFQPGEFLDFSIESNRRKFISAAGNPVDLGANGQLPTGTAAAVYLPGDQTNQALNAGSGGDFASQGTQVPGETPGPAATAAATLAGVGGFQATVFAAGSATLTGVGGFQAEGESDVGVYVPKGILFDGTTDFMLRGSNLTGIADSGLGLVSVWFRLDDIVSGRFLFGHDGTRAILDFSVSGAPRVVEIDTRQAGGGICVRYTSVTTFPTADPNYHHALLSWDRAAGITQLYLDDVSDKGGPTVGGGDAAYAGVTTWTIGARQTGTLKHDGGLSDLYFTTEFLDLDIVANRRKFIDATGNPVFLGTTGELPTGTATLVYLRGELTDQGVNAGTGGNFVSQATQVPNETTGPVDDAIATLAGVGGLQATVDTRATLQGVGGFQSAGTLLPFPVVTLPGVGGFQAEGLSQGETGADLPGVGGFQAIATFIGAVSDATLPGVGGMSVRAVNLDFGIPNEEALVCDPALDSSSPGSGTLPRSWNGL